MLACKALEDTVPAYLSSCLSPFFPLIFTFFFLSNMYLVYSMDQVVLIDVSCIEILF